MQHLDKTKILRNVLRILLPLLLGGLILWWMYRDFDWDSLWRALNEGMDWDWMWISLPFGVLAQLFRAMRWKQTLVPLGERPRLSTCIHAIFLSYASSLVVPRIGEVLRCGVLKRYDGVSFAKSLGTVVTERIVDAVLMLFFSAVIVLSQMKLFTAFLSETGLSFEDFISRFSIAGYWVTAACMLVLLLFVYFLARRLAWFSKTKKVFSNMKEGVLSLRGVNNIPLYIIYSIGIWVAYFLHFYLTFFCFKDTAGLGLSAALVAFVVGSFAVIVPTPNGAGPWHFAVKTVLVLYGVSESIGVVFVLIVHSVQTLLVMLLGVYAAVGLACTRHKEIDLLKK